MTICIAVNQGDYVFMAADTRVTFGRPKVYHEDGHIKLYDTGIGLITGSGWGQLLDEVKDSVIDEDIHHTDQISNIVQNEINKARDENWHEFTNDEIDQYIALTGWFYSYITTINNQPKARIAFIHGSEFEDREPGMMKSLPDGAGCIWVDGSIDSSLVDYYLNILNTYVSSHVSGVSLPDSGKALLTITHMLISKIADACEGVSKEFYCGFHGPAVKYMDGPLSAEWKDVG